MVGNKKRIMITVSKKSLEIFDRVQRDTGLTKSAQIQNLVAKYLDKEYESES
jgi:hypothetical protein